MNTIPKERLIAEIARLAQIPEAQVVRYALEETMRTLFNQRALKYKDAFSKEDWVGPDQNGNE